MKRILIFCLILSICVIGCKRKSEKTEETVPIEKTYTETEYKALKKQVQQLTEELSIYDDTYKTLDSFKSKNVVQAGKWYYNKIKDKIVLNRTSFFDDLDNSGETANITLGDNIMSLTANNWRIQTNTGEINLCIPDSVYGKISLYKYDMSAESKINPSNVANGILQDYLEDNEIEIKTRRDIFSNNSQIGQELTGKINIYDTTENGTETQILASQVYTEDQISQLGLESDSELDITVLLDEEQKKTCDFKVGFAYIEDTAFWYEFLIYDNSGTLSTNDLLSSVMFKKKPINLR